MGEPSEDTLVEFVLGTLPRAQHDDVSRRVEASEVCQRVVEEYQDMIAALRNWRELPPEHVAAGSSAIVQRLRLHRLLDRLFADAGLRRQIGLDPEGTLVTLGIAPTPQLLAAFKDLGLSSREQFPGELDERITKLRRWLEWFPGASPGPLGF